MSQTHILRLFLFSNHRSRSSRETLIKLQAYVFSGMLHQRAKLKERASAMMNQENENCRRICFNSREIPLKYEQRRKYSCMLEGTSISSKFFPRLVSSTRLILPTSTMSSPLSPEIDDIISSTIRKVVSRVTKRVKRRNFADGGMII